MSPERALSRWAGATSRGLLLLLSIACPAAGQTATTVANVSGGVSLPALAYRIVTTAAGVKPGEVVVIAGGKHTISLMEALAIEVQKAGGFPNLLLSSDSVTRSFYRDVPDEYLALRPEYFGAWVRAAQVWIGLPGEEDFAALIKGVPEARMAKAADASQFLNEIINQSGIRVVFVAFPSAGQAALERMPFPVLAQMHWDAVGANYDEIAAKGEALRAALAAATEVRVTSPAGTDVTFAIRDRGVMLDDGRVTAEEARGAVLMERFATLPGGQVVVAPIETSGRGKLVVLKGRCRDGLVIDASSRIEDGKLTGFQARDGAKCVQEAMEAYRGPGNRLGTFSIGLNPALHPVAGSLYAPGSAAGMVYLGFGGNEMFGGENATQGGFAFPILNATVLLDGRTIVRDGRLVE